MPPASLVHVVPLGPARDLTLSLQRGPDGFRLGFRPGRGRQERVLALSLSTRPFSAEAAEGRLPWAGCRGPGVPDDPGTAFLDEVERRLREAWKVPPEGGAWTGPWEVEVQDGRWPLVRRREPPEFLADLVTAQLQVKAARAHLQSLLPRSLAAHVQPFHPEAQWPLCLLLAGDGSGRLAQLARAAPGTLLFALEHARRAGPQGREAAQAFCEAVRAGVTLKRALQPLLEDWATCALRPEGPGELAALVSAQRLLLRRLHPGLAPQLAWLPPPLALVPEDIPTLQGTQWRWLEVMKQPGVLRAWDPAHPRAVQAAFCRWVSAHALELCPEDVPILASQVLPRGLRLARSCPLASVTGRRGPPGPLERAWTRHPDLRLSGPDLDLQLPHPFEETARPGLQVRPLRRASELVAEGRQMQHCAGNLWEAAAAGELFLLHAETDEGPLTVSFRGPAEAPALGRVAGPRNRPPTPAQQAAVLAWWQELAQARGWEPRQEASPLGGALPSNLAELEAWAEEAAAQRAEAELLGLPEDDEANMLFTVDGGLPGESPW